MITIITSRKYGNIELFLCFRQLLILNINMVYASAYCSSICKIAMFWCFLVIVLVNNYASFHTMKFIILGRFFCNSNTENTIIIITYQNTYIQNISKLQTMLCWDDFCSLNANIMSALNCGYSFWQAMWRSRIRSLLW